MFEFLPLFAGIVLFVSFLGLVIGFLSSTDLFKKYCTKENILNYFFLIVAGSIPIFFYDDDLEECIRESFWYCVALVALHYLAQLTKSFKEKEK